MNNMSKEMFAFAEQIPVPLFKVDTAGNIHYCNTATSKKLGYKKSEILKKNAYDLFQEKDHPQLKERLSNITKNRSTNISYEYTLKKKNGKTFPVLVHSKVVPSEESGQNFLIGSFFDVSDKKKTEESIKKSRQEIESLNNFNQGIIDGISDELIVMDAETGRIEFANNKVMKRTGIALKQLKNKKCHELYHFNNKVSPCQASDVIQTGTKKDFERNVYDKNKNLVSHLQVTVHPIFDNKGNVQKLIHITKDITEKKIYEKRLSELNERLLNLYRTSASLQKAISTDKICEIALKTFESLGFDRIRIYRYENNRLYGIKANHLEDEDFLQVEFPVHKKYSKAYRCIHNKKPIIEKTTGRKKIANFLEKPAGLASGSLPLISENEVFGMISFDNKISGREIYEKDLELYMTFANQIASAMQKSEFIKENEKKVERLSTLYDIYNAINQTLDMDKIMNMVVIRIVKLLKVDRCSILLLDNNQKHLKRLAVFDKKNIDPGLQKKISFTNTISGRVLRFNRTVYLQDVEKSNYYGHKEKARERSLMSYLGIPLSLENKAIGVINIHTRSKRNFSENEIELLKALSSTASMMIENSRLYERIKYDKENFSDLLNITQHIGKLHDIDSLVKEVLNEAVSFTGADHGFVMLLDNNVLELTLSQGNPCTDPDKMKFKLGSGVVGKVAKTGKPYIIDDVSEDNNYINMDNRVQSTATIPLIKKGSVMGVLHLESSKPEKFKFFSKSLGVLTNHISVTTENIRLYSQVLNFNKELESKIDEATKELQEKNEELKRMDEMKSDFVSNVSHELRTPLTSIMGYTKLLSQGKLGSLNQQQSHVVSTIVSESERLSRLINDVLDLSKLESGKINFKFEEVDTTQLIKDTVGSMKNIAESKNVNLHTSLADNLVIDTSPDLLKQAVINLLNNAVKFTNSGGKVTVTTQNSEDRAKIIVKDTGVGIPKNEIPKLFDKFYQVDSSMTKEHSGTGLGLVIVKHIAELHGGKVDVSSAKGKGSTFTIDVPIKQAV